MGHCERRWHRGRAYQAAIDIRNAFSVVELPSGLPSTILAKMARARVAGRPLEISEDSAPNRAPRRRRDDGDAPVRRRERA